MSAEELYKILGVSNTATQAQIEEAYTKKFSELFSDGTSSKKGTETAATYLEIFEAFKILSDPKKRNTYDETGIVFEIKTEKESFGESEHFKYMRLEERKGKFILHSGEEWRHKDLEKILRAEGREEKEIRRILKT